MQDASALNSRDVFVVQQAKHQWVWRGSGCPAPLAATADQLSENLLQFADTVKESTVVVESNDDKKLWKALGGKKEYPCGACLQKPNLRRRLFQCGTVIGKFNGTGTPWDDASGRTLMRECS